MTTTWSARARPTGSSSSALRRRAIDLVGSVAAAAQAALLLLAGRREHEDQQRVGADRLDLPGAVDLDLQHDVGARRRLGRRRAVVVAEELGPLEEPAGGDALLERLGGR